MPKRRTGWTEAKISRFIKEGELPLYKPWLTIQGIPSGDNLKGYEYAGIKHISQSDKEWANRLKKYIL